MNMQTITIIIIGNKNNESNIFYCSNENIVVTIRICWDIQTLWYVISKYI